MPRCSSKKTSRAHLLDYSFRFSIIWRSSILCIAPLGGLYPMTETNYKSSLSFFSVCFVLLLQINGKVQMRSYSIISFYILKQWDGWNFWHAQAYKMDQIQQETDCSLTPADLFSFLWVTHEQNYEYYIYKIWLFTTSDIRERSTLRIIDYTQMYLYLAVAKAEMINGQKIIHQIF